jgi:hypothetical protein
MRVTDNKDLAYGFGTALYITTCTDTWSTETNKLPSILKGTLAD